MQAVITKINDRHWVVWVNHQCYDLQAVRTPHTRQLMWTVLRDKSQVGVMAHNFQTALEHVMEDAK